MRLPFFVLAQFVTSFLLLARVPAGSSGRVLQLMDRLAGTSFFNPGGWSSAAADDVSGGETPSSGAPYLVPRASRGVRADPQRWASSREVIAKTPGSAVGLPGALNDGERRVRRQPIVRAAGRKKLTSMNDAAQEVHPVAHPC